MLHAPDHLKYWKKESNPATGEQFEIYRNTLMDLGNPEFDLERYLSDDYAAEQTRRLDLRFRFTPDPMGEECLSYYRSLGLKKEMFEADSFFDRWVLLSPLEKKPGARYPLILIFHGGMNTIETEEFSDFFAETAGRDGCMLLYPQNTNADRVLEILEKVKAAYPVDEERIYVTGFSQGGYQARALVTRHPELFAAYAPAGNDLYRPFDFQNVPYTEAELQHFKEISVPFFQIVGCREPNYHVPRLQWHPRKTMLQDLRERFPGKYDDVKPGMDFGPEMGPDPTYPKTATGGNASTIHPAPQPGEDIPRWALNRVNLRLELQNCEPRDVETCLGYLTNPDTETHAALGFYGDRDGIQYFYGRKHYIADVWSRTGLHTFRYAAVENAPHWPPLAWAELAWDFFRGFRREAGTGRLLMDRYSS